MTREKMEFPNTFDEFIKSYGFKDDQEVYTNGSELIPVFRVKQWLNHIKPCEDCVSREAALKEMERYHDDCAKTSVYTRLGFETAMEVVKSLPPVTPNATLKPRLWIPVSERLPEENKTVIASTKYGVYPESRYTKEDGWEWAYEAGADYWVELEDVTAWMPLPKTYKAESEDK